MSVIKITDETSPGSVIRINDTSSSVSVQETSTYVVSTPYVSIEKLTQLKDTPDDVQGKANQALTVKADETGLEFTDFQSQIDSNDSATSAALSSLGAQVSTKLNSSSYTAQDVLAKLQTVDGSGSGLNADTLDGTSSAGFLRSNAADTFSGKLTGTELTLGGSDIITSAAKLQVNGLMRTGDVYLHEGGSSPTGENKSLVNNSGALQWDGDQVWHAGNMGSGSGLDADTLDGVHGSQFVRSDAFSVTTATIDFKAPANSEVARFSNDVNTNAMAVRYNGTGNEFNFIPKPLGVSDFGDEFKYNFNSSVWQFDKTPFVGSDQVWHSGNDGSGSGLDADKLDGLDSGDFAQIDGNNTFTGKNHSDLLTYERSVLLPEATDLDTVLTSGFYVVNLPVNGPDAQWYYLVVQQHANSDTYVMQTLTRLTGGTASATQSYRTRNNGTWNNWSTIWSSTNDGSGSGLDADKLGGIASSQYIRNDIGSQTIQGNTSTSLYLVTGDTTSTAAMIFGDTAGASRAGMTYNNSTEELRIYSNGFGNADILFKSGGQVDFTASALFAGGGTQEIWHAGNDGYGSGLDADMLDGIQAASFIRSDQQSTFSNGFAMTNLEGAAAVNEGSVIFDASQGLMINRRQQNVSNATVTILDGANVEGGANVSISNLGSGTTGSGTGTEKFIFSIDQGAGSGLDADKLDGVQGSDYWRKSSDNYTSSNAIFDNGKGVYAKDAGGTTRQLAIMNSSDQALIGDSALSLLLRSNGTNTLNGNEIWHSGNDSGFMKKVADIPSSADLNTYTTLGMYHQNSNANTTSGSNYPINLAGWLEVYTDGSMTYQRYTEYLSGTVYTRVKYNSSWSAWQGGLVTVSTSAPSGGNDGDVWYQV